MGGKGGGGEAAAARADEYARQEAVRAGTSRINDIFGQFGDDFFDQRKQAYVDYAQPQLQQQYNDAQRELTYALARGGLLDSSVRGAKMAELQQRNDLLAQQIGDQALAAANQDRNAVEDSRANLIATLNATGDATGVANQALTRASVLSKPQAYSPLTNLFADFTSALGTQGALERANAYSGGMTGLRYNTGLFTPNAGAVVNK